MPRFPCVQLARELSQDGTAFRTLFPNTGVTKRRCSAGCLHIFPFKDLPLSPRATTVSAVITFSDGGASSYRLALCTHKDASRSLMVRPAFHLVLLPQPSPRNSGDARRPPSNNMSLSREENHLTCYVLRKASKFRRNC